MHRRDVYTIAVATVLSQLGGVVRGDDGINRFLFDLAVDPMELKNVYKQAAQAGNAARLEERMAYWRNVTIPDEDIQVPDSPSFFAAAGGYMPWVDAEVRPVKKARPQGTAKEGVPNLVFIMMDDVGWNDLNHNHAAADGDNGAASSAGSTSSSWLDFATPNIDAMLAEGVFLSRHYTGWVCGPTRASFLTGRYPYRLGYGRMPEAEANLPLGEATLASELQLLGYRTALVGKWHLGFQSWQYTPTYRGFDRFYGFYGGSVGYYSKVGQQGFFDLHDQEQLVTDPHETSPGSHLTTLLQGKVEATIADHAANHAGTPLFLYYATQNVHVGGNEGLEAPDAYVKKCGIATGTPSDQFSQHQIYCALVIMLDEAVGNTLCALRNARLESNTLTVLISDNGGMVSEFAGVSYPFRGGKGAYLEGGVHNNAIVYGPSLVPVERRGAVFDGLVHVADWFPTFLGLASQGTWTGPANKYDGHDVFEAIITGGASPRTEVFVNFDAKRNKGAMIIGTSKLVYGNLSPQQSPEVELELTSSLDGVCLGGAAQFFTPSPTIPTSSPTARPSKDTAADIVDGEVERDYSTLTCGELGWTNAATFGNPIVCGESDLGLGGCSGLVDWTSAGAFCAAGGARLCTLSELLGNEASATGCGYEGARVWSGSACAGDGFRGYAVAFGSTRGGSEVLCIPPGVAGVYNARCCADVAVPADDNPAPSSSPSEAAGGTVLSIDSSSLTVNTVPSFQPSATLHTPVPTPSRAAAIIPTAPSSIHPTMHPTTALPTSHPKPIPTLVPTKTPSPQPILIQAPFLSHSPSPEPTVASTTANPTSLPTSLPTASPTYQPTPSPTVSPTPAPTQNPTQAPSREPTPVPTKILTPEPTLTPTLSHTPETTAQVVATVSLLSCSELGWNTDAFGSSLVCGESDLGLGGCSGAVTWAAALAFCEAGGARLCTVDELKADETRGTGCASDGAPLWSSTPCDGGMSTGFGSALRGPTGCVPATSKLSTRCCADLVSVTDVTFAPTLSPTAAKSLAEETSLLSCSELGWNTDAFGSSLVCGESDLGLGGCSGAVTWAAALAFCEAGGARLCTVDELKADETRGTGCASDGAPLWSSTPCNGGMSTGFGSALRGPTGCVPTTSKLNTRCCADVSSGDAAISPTRSAASSLVALLIVGAVALLYWIKRRCLDQRRHDYTTARRTGDTSYDDWLSSV